MTIQPWKKFKEEVKMTNPYWEYRLATFELPNGRMYEYHYPHVGTGAIIVSVRDDGKILMIHEYRALISRIDTTFPAGKVEEGETPQEAALRELREETKWKAGKLEKVGSFFASPGTTNGRGDVYVATQLSEDENPLSLDDAEEIETFWTTPDEIDLMIANGTIMDGWAISAWTIAKPQILSLLEEKK